MELNHIGIKCSNIDESYAFYTEVLGMEKLFELDIMGSRAIFLGIGDDQIELEEVSGGVSAPAAPPEAGITHIAFKTNDIEAEAELFSSRGAEFLIPPFQIRPTRKTAFIKAPDSVLIQLVQDIPEE